MIELAPQTLIMTSVQEIFLDTYLGNTWTNRTPQQISRTGISRSIPIYTPIQRGMIKSDAPYFSDNIRTRGTGTRIPIRTTDPPYGFNASPDIDDIWQYPTPDLRKSKKIDTSIDGRFTQNLVSQPIFTEVLCDKLSDSSCRDIYTRCRMNLTADPGNVPT